MGCSSKTVHPEHFSQSNSETDYLFFKSVQYDAYGRPSFYDPLVLRPTQVGVLYYIVQYDNEIASSYFLIKTSQAQGEYSETMQIIYEDTSLGFQGGLQFTQAAVHSNGGNSEAQAIYLAVALGAPIVGTLGGFLYGVVHSSGELVTQVNESLFVDYKEEMVLFTSLKYDEQNRLIYLHEYDNFKKNVYSRKYEYLPLAQTPCRVRHKVTGKEKLFLEDDSCLALKQEVF